MSTVFTRAARRGRSFAPRVENLEGRDCPNCTMTFHDGLLSIVGDRQDDDVAIVNTWTGTQVRCIKTGEKSSATFMDVRAIDVRTLGGDDRVSFVSVSNERPAPVPTLRVDLGGGDDTFAAVVDVPPGPCDVAVNGGAGQDDILTSFSFGSPSDPSVPVFVSLDGGAGDDVLTAQHKGAQPGSMTCVLLGGAGDDVLTASTDFVPAVQSSAVPAVQFTLDMDGGAGDDVLTAQHKGAQPGSMTCVLLGGAGDDVLTASTAFVPAVQSSAVPAVQFTLDMDGGAGDDVLTAQHKGAQPGSMTCVLLGGAGDDVLTASTAFVPAVQSSAVPAVQFTLDMDGGAGADGVFYLKQRVATHKSTAHLAGGLGNDTVAVVATGGLDSLASLAGTFDYTEIDGGAGNDRLAFVDLPDPGFQTVLGYSYVVTMHGGAGNDVLYADASYFNGGGNTGSILEYGDGGDDKLALFYDGPFSTLLVDGGAGTDTGLSPAHHTANVTVVNCEL